MSLDVKARSTVSRGRGAGARLAVALDVATLGEAREWVERLWPAVQFFKVGMGLFSAAGPAAVAFIKERGGRVFLDLKYHDIPNSVGQGVASAARLGVDLLTVHVAGGRAMLERAAAAAAEAAQDGGERTRVVGVTVLTSLDARAMAEVGCSEHLQDLTLRRTELAREAGLDGIVCSPLEVKAVKAAAGPDFLAVTPGIRPAGSELGDQARAATPEAALQRGADVLVVGRPILRAADPLAAAERIVRRMESALAAGPGAGGKAGGPAKHKGNGTSGRKGGV